ncbi:MAG: YggS family pyridoxal phosphate-dependent enzyme [Gemmataceae bacterium]
MSAITLSRQLAERLQLVEERIRAACRRAGRARSEVTMVAVTKSVSVDIAALLVELGINDLAENRPQSFWERAPVLPQARWHFIGHLQRNKIERTLPQVHLLHSVDSRRLLTSLEADAAKRQRPLDVLLEINASREANKQGIAPEDLPGLVPNIVSLRWVCVRGLMTMAALAENPEEARPTFADLRNLRDTMRPHLTPAHDLRDLSMGMSHDFEVAIEEGATFIRLGTILFDGLTS